MKRFEVVLLLFLLLLQLQDTCLGMAKFTNIKCKALDANFTTFTTCRLRAVKRNVNELSIKAHLLQAPLSDATMRWQLMKKASGYKPFLYDVTADVCEYLDKHNHPFVNIILNSFGNYSTVLQKCPISGDISLDSFPFPEQALESLPLPTGEYAVFATFGSQGVPRAYVQIYFMLEESL